MSVLRTSASASSGLAWPTPVTADAARASSTYARGNPTLLGVAQQWPTPTAMDSRSAARAGYDYGNPGTTLTDAMRMWPTPDARVSNDAEDPTTWRARQEALRAKGVNGNGAGVPLAIASKEWPTPRATDGAKGGPSARDSSGSLHLPSMAVWATPTASESANRTRTEPASVTDGRGHGAHLSAQANSWATPTARDWKDAAVPPEIPTNGMLGRQAPRSLPDLTTETDGEPTSSDGRVLNPQFVEALMGFPLGWTDFELLETPSSRRRRNSLSDFLLSALERRSHEQ